MNQAVDSGVEFEVSDEASMIELGRNIAATLSDSLTDTEGCSIHLHGELGVGKTTLVRSILQALGAADRVKSPTYTLVEPYELKRRSAYHFDLYRLTNPEELEYLGLRDYLSPESLLFVEWPEKGEGVLPPADVHIRIQYADSGRKIRVETGQGGRNLWIFSLTD